MASAIFGCSGGHYVDDVLRIEPFMKRWPRFLACVLMLLITAGGLQIHAAEVQHLHHRWTAARAWHWYHRQPWMVGCNYIPATAENTIEMWQGSTYDPKTINRELGYAHRLGFNVIRVFLNVLVWQHNPQGYQKRIGNFLAIASGHHIRVAFVIFDDCWLPTAKLGPQPPPIPGVHNSQWVQCPGPAMAANHADWPLLKDYEQSILRAFRNDHRVIFWDLYNECHTLPLLQASFRWAREIKLSQPITSCVYGGPVPITNYVLRHSDIITFHNYSGPHNVQNEITSLRHYHRPVINTEYMRRPVSTFALCLPVFKRNDVGCFNWGLTNGKTQTIYPWWSKPGSPPPKLWFHNILHRDGRPFSVKEVHLIEHLTGAKPWPAR